MVTPNPNIIYRSGSTGPLTFDQLDGNFALLSQSIANITPSESASYAATASSVTILNQDVTISGSILVSGSIIPNTNGASQTSSFSLGSPTNAWKDIYVSNGTINFLDGAGNVQSTLGTGNNQLIGDTTIDGTLKVDTINPYFIGGNINLNGTEIRNNPDETIIGIGKSALQYATGINNIALGKAALQSVTTGDANVALGNGALQSCEGNDNVAVGRNAGVTATTGANNIFIGRAAEGSTITSSNEINLGNSSHTVIRAAVTSITSLSDERDKKNIEDSEYGLDFINSLRPVKFEWDARDGVKKDIKDLGFIAQDLQKVDDDYLGLVYNENPEKLEANYGKLIPVLVKAIQDLSKELNELKK